MAGSPSMLIDDSPEERFSPVWRAVALESEVLAILQTPPEPGERLEFAYRRKEAELVACFRRLTIVDAYELKRRLKLVIVGDPIAARFGRLVIDRRERLLAFLANARWRAATTGSVGR